MQQWGVRLGKWIYSIREYLRLARCRLRVHIFRLMGAQGIDGKCLIDRGVRIERPWLTRLGQRCVLQSDVWLNVVADAALLDIGAYTFLGRGVEIEVSTRVVIGRGGLIGPGVYITDHNHCTALGTPMFQQPCTEEPVLIGDDVWVGANAVILPGVEIGDGAIIGAGAVVTKSIEAMTVAVGVPARAVGLRNHRGARQALDSG